jgi:hypothetical protein
MLIQQQGKEMVAKVRKKISDHSRLGRNSMKGPGEVGGILDSEMIGTSEWGFDFREELHGTFLSWNLKEKDHASLNQLYPIERNSNKN